MGDNSTYYDQINLEKQTYDIEDASDFYEVIDRKHLTHSLSPERPYVYWTMEIYDKSNGIKGGGGLGVLAADTRRVAQQLELPFVVVTPFYRTEFHQSMDKLQQVDYEESVSPDDYGFSFVDNIEIKTLDNPATQLSVFVKQLGSTKFVTVSEPNFGALYAGESNSDHRLYQEVALGFGGYAALKKVGLKPSVIQLNETATIFAAIARLDELCANGMNLYEAVVYVRKHTLYTNHTLLQAAEGEFSLDQFKRYVFPNIRSCAIKQWIKEQFDESARLRNSALAIELCEAKNGVSRLHAKVTDFRDTSGERVKFHAVTNGIDMETWVLPEILKTYRELGIVDKFGMVTEDYKQNLHILTAEEIRRHKRIGRSELNKVLVHRKNQYGKSVQLPDDAVVYNFKRRFVSYKRPYMPFEHIPTFKRILSNYDAYYILAGKVHQGDRDMYSQMQQLLELVDKDPYLKERVHFVQDYDEELGRALSIGADVAINVPEVGLEACGTSWEKDIANFGILVSTPDGGVADISPLACLEVHGATYREEVASLYVQMNRAGLVLADDDLLQKLIYRQVSAYLPVISGARMMKDYLRFLFDK